MNQSVKSRFTVTIFLLLSFAVAISSCEKNEGEDLAHGSTKTEFELSSVKYNYYVKKYRNRDSDAAFAIAMHHMVVDPSDVDTYYKWLERSLNLKNRKAGIFLLKSLYIDGACERYSVNSEIFKKLFPEDIGILREIERDGPCESLLQ